MKFNVKQMDKNDVNSSFLVIDKESEFKILKKSIKKGESISVFLDESVINLTQKLYGKNKAESIKIQKENSKKMLGLFKLIKRLIKLFARRDIQFDGTFFCENLEKKQNNNDFMILAMLETYFCFNSAKRLEASVDFACDYLDKENQMHNMCDFQNDICVGYRETGKNKPFGCCSPACRDENKKVCDLKCLTCKIFMCDYLVENGYYFDVNSVAILKKNLSFIERKTCKSLFFTNKRSTVKSLWVVRIFEILFGFIGILILLSLIGLIILKLI